MRASSARGAQRGPRSHVACGLGREVLVNVSRRVVVQRTRRGTRVPKLRTRMTSAKSNGSSLVDRTLFWSTMADRLQNLGLKAAAAAEVTAAVSDFPSGP